jgi:hypothetical protein
LPLSRLRRSEPASSEPLYGSRFFGMGG